MNDELKDTLAALTDEEKEEARIILDGGENTEEETATTTTTDEDENQPSATENTDEDENQPSARTAPAKVAMTIPQTRALLKSHGLTDDNTINALACEAIEKNWDKTDLLGAAIKAMRDTDPEIAQEATGSPSAISNGRGSGGGGASFGTYSEAIAFYKEQGLSHAAAVSKVNKEHPELRAASFGPKAAFRQRA